MPGFYMECCKGLKWVKREYSFPQNLNLSLPKSFKRSFVNKTQNSSESSKSFWNAPFRLDRTITGGGILVYVSDDTPSKLLNISYVSSDTECLAIEINLRKTKWLLICSYNPHKNNISNHSMNLNKKIDKNSSRYENIFA